MPREDDPRFGPGGQFARKPGGVDYAPPPQLTLEAARAFEAYDRTRAAEQTAQAATWTSGRALSPWETEDRIAYNQARAEIRKRLAPALPLLRARDTYTRLGRQAMAEEPPDFAQPTDPGSIAYAQQAAHADPRFARGPEHRFGQGPVELARTRIPYADVAADVAGELGGRVGRTLIQAGPMGTLEKALPDQYRPSTIAGNVGEWVASSLVPQEVWQAALELMPGVGTVPGVVSAVRKGTPEAILAGRKAAAKLGQSEAFERVLKEAASERGALTLGPGDEAAAGAGEAASSSLPADVLPLPLKPVLDTLSAAEQQQLAFGIKVIKSKPYPQSRGVDAVLKIAERYERDSPQRAQLLDLVEAQTQHLPASTRKAIKAFVSAVPTSAERKLATKAQRARQASGADIAFRGEGTTEEKAVAAFKAMGGKQPQRFTPIGEKFTDGETRDLFAQIEQANAAGKLTSIFDAPNATSALSLLTTGHRLEGVASEATKPLNLMPGEIKLLGKIFGAEFEAAIPRTAKHMDGLKTFIDIINLPRALVTAVDISAAGRQGIILAARNPIEVAKSFPTMFRAMASEEGFAKAAQNLRQNKYFEDALSHRLELTNIGGDVAGEEPFISRFASKIPLVKGSERGFVMYLDTLRLLTYEKTVARWERLAAKNKWEVERLNLVKDETARFINHASGRGSLGAAGEFVPALNAAFFAPKFLVSRPQSIWDMVRPGATIQSRQLAFENLGAMVGSGTAALLTARQFGADVELDPRSSDFGKMRFGNTRIEFWGGFQPIARYIAQISTAQRKPLAGGKMEFAYPGTSALRFFRSKLAPGGAMIYDYTAGGGKGYSGEDLLFNPRELGFDEKTRTLAWDVFLQKVLPLSIQDAIEGYNMSGWKGAIAGAGVSAIGGGVGSFEPSEREQKSATKAAAEQGLEPYLAAPAAGFKYREEAFVSVFGEDARKYKTFGDLQAAYVEQVAPKIATNEGISLRSAKELAKARLATVPVVASYLESVKTFQDNWWRDHPDEARQAWEAGLDTAPREDIRKELGIK